VLLFDQARLLLLVKMVIEVMVLFIFKAVTLGQAVVASQAVAPLLVKHLLSFEVLLLLLLLVHFFACDCCEPNIT
jgi:hypothetical protein